jgi:hypothetical protein
MNNDETNDEEVVTTWGFVIHGEVVPVTVTDVYAMLGHEPREFYSAEVTYRDETYRVDCRAWTDANEPLGPVMWLLRDLIERRVPVTEVLMPGQVPRAELEARNADLSRDRDTALAAALDLAADRDATRAILRAPRCSNCAEIATRKSTITDTVWCDGHAPAAEWLSADLPHAAALRSLMKESPR